MRSHRVSDTSLADAEDEELYQDDSVAVRVTQRPGLFCHISAKARVAMPPKDLYVCLVHPDNTQIYRSMEKCTYRRILEDDGAGRRLVAVTHQASWRFLAFSGRFETRLRVSEDAQAMRMAFELAPEAKNKGLIRQFEGRWQVRAHPAGQSLSISSIEQDIRLGMWVPPPLDRLVKSICARQVRWSWPRLT
jgi:hypothetical protein